MTTFCNGSKRPAAQLLGADLLGDDKAICPACGERNRVRADGTMRNHYRRADIARVGIWDGLR